MKLSSREMSIVVADRLERMPYQTKMREDWVLEYLFGEKEDVFAPREFGMFDMYEVSCGSGETSGWLLIGEKEIIWCDKEKGPMKIIGRYGE